MEQLMPYQGRVECIGEQGGTGRPRSKGIQVCFSLLVMDTQISLVIRYFGRARELPGVKELFEQYGALVYFVIPPKASHLPSASHITEQEKQARVMTKDDTVIQLDSDYYGYRDEDDGALLKYERGLEEKGMHYCAY